jgi:type VI secretion system protein ImpF
MAKEDVFLPSLWHRLMAAGESEPQHIPIIQQSFEQLKASVAHDLEDLLNTRVAIPTDRLASYPRCRKSIFNYGLIDFAAFCTTSAEDRKAICRHVNTAIARFEPRLTHVQVDIFIEQSSTNRIDFVISGKLKARPFDRIEFNAMLQPSSLRYSVKPDVRGTAKRLERP